MRSSLYFILLAGLLLLSPHSKAQDTGEPLPLSQVLTILESRYEVQFNYLQVTIDPHQVALPNENLSLEEALQYLRDQTVLLYNLLENKIVSVRNRDKRILCGYLLDKEDQSPLWSATIQSDNGSTLTNNDGYFELAVEDPEEEVIIRYLGYKTIIRPVKFFSSSNCNPVYMLVQEEQLSKVILSSYLVEGIDQLNTGDLEIDFNRFGILPGLIETDVLQAIQSFPGIQSVNETVSNINIRGGTHDQNLILWDDIKMYQSGHFFGLISAFNPHITNKVSLKKNGTSAEYSDGVSGTIAMQTRESLNVKLNGNFGLNLIDANGSLDIPIGKRSSVEIAARKSLNDLLTTPTYIEYFDRIAQNTELEINEENILNTDQQFDFYDVSMRWLYLPSEKDKIRLNFININNELVFNENAVIDGEETSRESSISQNSIAAGLLYQREWSERFSTRFHIYETDYKLKAINANLFDAQRFLQENKVSETGIKAVSDYTFSDAIALQIGYHFIETEVTNLDDVDVPIIRTLISEVVRSHSGFTQLGYRSKNASTFVQLGFRYNYLDKFKKSILEPRLSLNQQLTDGLSLTVSGELKHQITSQIINFQNDFLGVEKRRWQLSNDMDIPIIKGTQLALALNYSADGWLISTEGYYKMVDGITTQSQGFQNQYEFVKTSGEYVVTGFDMLLRKRFSGANIWISYSYMDNQYTFLELPEVSFPSNLDITHTVTVGTTYRFKGLKLAAGLNWHTGKPTSEPVFGNQVIDGEINYSAVNSVRLEDYLRLDASALYQFNAGSARIEAGVSVWNLLNEENEIGNYFRVNENGEAEEFVLQALTLTPNILIRAYF